MKIFNTNIHDVKVLQPAIHKDERGFFYEAFNNTEFKQAIGRNIDFVQDNHSKSKKNVLRGLHYQLPPNAQAKLVRVVQGEVLDVAVDIRKSSDTFGQWVGEILSCANRKQLWIPEGFAHGFLTLSDTAEIIYKVNSYYSADSDRSICWNDTNIGIDWNKTSNAILSLKDIDALSLNKAQVFK
jgi:dTDP-4-dehydrorhamnose 3,5-epimerase